MSKKRILVIDDEKNLCTVIKACLENIGSWQVLVAQSGSEGLAVAKSEHPDAILLDVMMPDINGMLLFQRLQENLTTNNIPVILLTAKVQTVDLKEFSQLSIAGVISKPFDPLRLSELVANTLGWQF
ncbi:MULTISPECIES: response regulator [unclassified Tolypothrix]|uniref:response regulator n=1 Tax=unclassified Tolypothrix TaxID=2649714 RepID=UPI0005EAABAD|nr:MULTISPECIES: response regulator [unclassified Tolypothrix]BAY91863.1 two-component response regulator [Microchaete diplosiphon NIES-3275]EKF04974.1 response regulator [Tolypothrix sp. PCC 7601]MBE9081272.1 response regulator [Tolypothrix sp. LEGE 11397]UYD25871.1 response regulator [Tolypothrix sp. PCC 7712]UYD31891.1 response regulator [Tolypothrix sp. PCC 7601]